MTRINSRSKGSAFERQIATDLRGWLGEEWTVTRNQTDRQGGQVAGAAGEFTVTCGDRHLPFTVECKAVEAFEYAHLWKSPVRGPLPAFWRQAKRQALIVMRRPMLIVKKNHGPILVVMWPDDVSRLLVATDARMRLRLGDDIVSVLRWDDFIATAFPSELHL